MAPKVLISAGEASGDLYAAGLVTADEMDKILADMDRDTKDLSILPLAPRMSIVWARKPN